MGKNQHVVGHEGRLGGQGRGRDTCRSPSSRRQGEAWEKAKSIARQGAQRKPLLHGKNGPIRARNTYGHDPQPH